mgnify:CR=1 FL=1
MRFGACGMGPSGSLHKYKRVNLGKKTSQLGLANNKEGVFSILNDMQQLNFVGSNLYCKSAVEI